MGACENTTTELAVNLTWPNIRSIRQRKEIRQTDRGKANIGAGENLTNLHVTQPGQTVGQSGRDKLY